MCCSEGKTTMPRIKIVMPANPTAIPNKQETIDQAEQRIHQIVQEYIENTDNSTDKNVVTDIHDSVRERSNARKSR